MKILKITASAQSDKSVSRKLVDAIVARHQGAEVIDRNLSTGIPQVTEEMIQAYYTPQDQLTEAQKELLTLSNQLVQEIKEADALVIGFPIYNFSVPGALKAYFDLVARVGITFKYTDQGPVGLIEDKKTYLVVASGGTEVEGSQDFATGYTKHFLNFLGIKDITVIPAGQLMFGAEQVIEKANNAIAALAV